MGEVASGIRMAQGVNFPFFNSPLPTCDNKNSTDHVLDSNLQCTI